MKKKHITPYDLWVKNDIKTYEADYKTFPIGVGGVLYFPNCFHEDILDEEKFQRISPFADDIWYKTMSLMKKVRCCNVRNLFSSVNKRVPIQKSQADSLSMLNILKNKNDSQFQKVLTKYPQLKSTLNEE